MFAPQDPVLTKKGYDSAVPDQAKVMGEDEMGTKEAAPLKTTSSSLSGFVSESLESPSEPSTQSDPSPEAVAMLRWDLYGSKSRQIMSRMDYEPSSNQGQNDRKGMLAPFAIIEAMSTKHCQKQRLGYLG
ncbi:hypothetical protein AMTR_s00139p00055160 [Amborella trichopoda]|uniref:Uncharacterized protein n=1 Tax=Amborella trichopoda TaxID=13333 RepID=W1NF97_AMBTC|nr:hypothetical protein AMTR_s00139p00055160 [Amborella trichopoda]